MRTLTIILAAVISIILSGCSHSDRPDSLEPVITMLPATAITRTEAEISVRIDNRSTSRLSFLRLHYGETDTIDRMTPVDNPEASLITIRLDGLKPGVSYSCYAEGGTSTATLRSQTISFTTIPNNAPEVSAAEPLSTSPVGIIVGFDILNDGGDKITEAGCEVANAATGEKSRVCLSPDDLGPGNYRLSISGLMVNTAYTITSFAANSVGEAKGEPIEYVTGSSITLHDAGILADLLGNKVGESRLTISGEMNGTDFRYLRILLGAPLPHGMSPVESSVTEADLSDVIIMEGGEAYDGHRYTVADEISTGLFADCARLRGIQLPATATAIARDAFARCGALESLTIPAGIASLLPSADCTALKSIEVSKANPNYKSIDDVLFDRDATEILWFPLAKTGEYTLPSSVTVIGEKAFAGTSITSLVIPPSVTAIRRDAFFGSALTDISLPDNITNISEAMFQGCVSLTTVRLGKDTELIGDFAFDNTSLRDLYVTAPQPPYVSADAFVNGSSTITAECTLHVPAGSKKIYQNHSRWKEFSRIVEL